MTLHAILSVFDDANRGKIVFGTLANAIGLVLVATGGYRLVEKVMRVCVGVMFLTVVMTAILAWPGTGEVARGLFVVPSIPDLQGGRLA